jgi:uracil-DNA glycosylase family 4
MGEDLVCLSCPLRGHTSVEPLGSTDSDLVLLLGMPNEEEATIGQMLHGYSGKLLTQIINTVGINISKVYATSVVKCRPSDGVLSKEMVKSCSMRLVKELASLKNRKLIVAVGETAKEFLSITGSFSDARGRFFDTKYGKAIVTLYPDQNGFAVENPLTGVSPLRLLINDLFHVEYFLRTGMTYSRVPFGMVNEGNHADVLKSIVGKVVAVDFETDGLNPWKKGFKVKTCSFASEDETWVIDLLDSAGWKTRFMQNLFYQSGKVVFFNAPFDVVVGRKMYGWDMVEKDGDVEDVQAIWFLLNGGRKERDDLKSLVLDFLDLGDYGIDWVKNKIEDIPLSKLYEYNAMDSYATLQLYNILYPRLEDNLVWSDIFGSVESTLKTAYEQAMKKIIGMIVELKYNGMLINKQYLMEAYNDLSDKLKVEEGKIGNVNLKSPKQVQKWLAEVGLNVAGTGKKVIDNALKMSSVSEEAKERLDIITNYRTLSKLISTYVEPLMTDWVGVDGCVHAEYSACIAETGRLSSSQPNMMNIPVRFGSIIEGAFYSRFEDGYIVKADFSQHELRTICNYAKDKKMKEFFESGVDIHTKVAMEIYGLKKDDDDKRKKELRRVAKGFNFGVIYGRGAKSIAMELGIPDTEAQKRISDYFKMFSNVKRWLDATKDFVNKHGFVRSMLGRVRWIALGENGTMQKAVNTPVQSLASDIASGCAWEIIKRMRKEGMKALVVNFIHDAILVDCPSDEVERVKEIIVEEVKKVKLPGGKFLDFEMDIEVGKNWGEL